MGTQRVWLGALLCLGLTGTVGHAADKALLRQGRRLFVHKWTLGDRRAADGDGLGPMFNATSCVGCHRDGGAGGAGGRRKNTILLDGQLLHAESTDRGYRRWRVAQFEARQVEFEDKDEGVVTVRWIRPERSERNTPALWGIDRIDQIPDDVLFAQLDEQEARGVSGRLGLTATGRPGRFGWKGDVESLDAFVRQACSNEVGLSVLGSPQPDSPFRPATEAPGDDLSAEQLLALTMFIREAPAPLERSWRETDGRARFEEMGCASCHVPNLGDVEGLYSDLMLHEMGPNLASAGGSYGGHRIETVLPPSDAITSHEGSEPAGMLEWRTPPLWGIADSAPYLHNGAARTLDQAIRAHGGEAEAAAAAYTDALREEKLALLFFLRELRAPARYRYRMPN